MGTATKHETSASRKSPTFNSPRTVVPGGYVSGPAAVALAAVGATEPIKVDTLDLRPTPFDNLYNVNASQRELANFLWTGYYNNIYVNASNLDRMALDEGASAGAGLFLQGVPSAPLFCPLKNSGNSTNAARC